MKTDRKRRVCRHPGGGEHRLLTVGTLLCVAASVAASLLPPLVHRIIAWWRTPAASSRQSWGSCPRRMRREENDPCPAPGDVSN